MSKELLIRLVRTMFLILVLAFVFVLLRSLGGPSLTTSVASPFDDVEIGETAIRRYQGQRVWVTRFSSQLRRELKAVDAVVINPHTGCKPSKPLCAVLALTDVDGIEIRYSLARPAAIKRSVAWIGGFVNPNSGAAFDLLGRAYQHTDSQDGNGLRVVELSE